MPAPIGGVARPEGRHRDPGLSPRGDGAGFGGYPVLIRRGNSTSGKRKRRRVPGAGERGGNRV